MGFKTAVATMNEFKLGFLYMVEHFSFLDPFTDKQRTSLCS